MTDLTANWHVSRHGMRDDYDQISNVLYGVYQRLANTIILLPVYERHDLSDRYYVFLSGYALI